MTKQIVRGVSFGFALFLLAACDSAEERAEQHYQTALEHLENGDVARAAVEFRNVFKLNGMHKEARLAYAKMRHDAGDVSEAYSQYLRLVEQYPDNFEGRRALAQMATLTGDWAEVERHIKAAAEQAPQDPIVRAVLTSIAYRDAIAADEETAIQAAAEQGAVLTTEAPELVIPHFVVVNEWIRQEKWPAALEALNAAISVSPETRGFYNLRLGVLNKLDKTNYIGAALEEMVRRFPKDETIQESLIDWYISRNDLDATEEFLRQRIDPAEEDPQNRMALLRFLATIEGPEATISEVDKMLTEDLARRPLYQALRAGQLFQAGDRETAISDLRSVVSSSEPSADLNDAKMVLVHMLIETGNQADARIYIEEVLAGDSSHAGAAKAKAAWLIEEDHTGEAIVLLRGTLRDNPRDPGLLTLLARAHERDGNRGLMADMLLLAVEASGSAPAEALNYAEFLADEGQYNHAASVLIEALDRQPNNTQLLMLLGQAQIHQKNWRQAQVAIDRLQALNETAQQQARVLTANLIAAQGREDDLLVYLEDMTAGNSGPDYMAEIGTVRTHVRNGELNAALAYLEQALELSPTDFLLRFLQASILAGMGKKNQAVAAYQELLDENPQSERTWMALYVLLAGTDTEQANRVLDQALSVFPDSADLNWFQASALEAQGDIEGAIDVYQALYKANSSSTLVANNLASLLVTGRDDAESLDQAYRIARRLRNSPVPHFSDTYGWIAYRRGEYEVAVKHLEFAARQLPKEPTVLYHLGATYAVLNRNIEARATLEKVADLEIPEDLAQKVKETIADLLTQVEGDN
ncbi:tetratricopeptide repeat protein [Ruegeria sp. AU67]|uniref:tetratricopeptide repeat protein n=1 Tax=Ruegeria sp. AU67 TaxID=2108530 RepID=UPI000D693E6B|nr:tetratricopeptide repeat protein [Ruegeria sp. AU67]